MTQESTFRVDVSALKQLKSLATRLAKNLRAPAWVHLIGDLGAGKTTFAQYFIAEKGYHGRVSSPTYAIMQSYPTPDEYNPQASVIHCDLYRLAEPEELDEIGVIEMVESEVAIALVEWPQKGKGILPPADVTVVFELSGRQRAVTVTANQAL